MENIAALAPMPSASVMITAAVKPGEFRNPRSVYRRSWSSALQRSGREARGPAEFEAPAGAEAGTESPVIMSVSIVREGEDRGSMVRHADGRKGGYRPTRNIR